MALVPLTLPPGVFRAGTQYQSLGRWYDANLVRWYENSMRPVGGWRKRSTSQLSGSCRGALTWVENAGDRWIALGTHTKLYVMSEDGTLTEITPATFQTGRADASLTVGYGYGSHGLYAYGVQRPDLGTSLPATTWSLDNWGQHLLAVSSDDETLLMWELDTTTDAAAVTNAPSCKGVVVTAERFILALGADSNARLVQWSDQESETVWTPASTNQAGAFELQTTGSIVAGRRIRGQTLIWTSVDVHAAQYVGPPFVYSFDRVGTGCGLIGAQAVASIETAAIWMSKTGFWIYDGYAKPLSCAVHDHVFSNINASQSSKVYAVHNGAFGEVWWFYPSASSVENDSYVVFNYRENHWSIGKLARTAAVDRGVFATPIAVGADGYVYEHEVGYNYDSAEVYVESGPLQIGQGDRMMVARQVLPDERTQGEVRLEFKTRITPEGSETTHGPYTITSGYTDVRFQGRQVSLRIEGARLADWRVGTLRLDAVAGSGR